MSLYVVYINQGFFLLLKDILECQYRSDAGDLALARMELTRSTLHEEDLY